jgi:hypothetical protein
MMTKLKKKITTKLNGLVFKINYVL